MIHVTDRELTNAFREHFSLVRVSKPKHTRSTLMLLFYAVECGLKAIYLKRNFLRSTDHDKFKDKNFKHDLVKILDAVGASADLKQGLGKVQIDRDRHSVVNDYHEMWRYGAKPISSNKNQDLGSKLEKIQQWVQIELMREN